MKKSFIVNEFGRVFYIKLLKVSHDLVFNVFYQAGIVVPQFIKPGFKVGPVSIAINNYVQFNIRASPKAKAVYGKV